MIKNQINYGKNQPLQEVEDGYIFVDIFVKKYYSYKNYFYGAVLSRHTVSIGPNTKPIILGY